MSKIRAHVFVSGVVQGVFFRSSSRRQALERGLKGWVRNLTDGRVEAVFEGEEESVKDMVKWCRKGPSHSLVEQVQVEWEPYLGEFERFEIR